MSQLRVLMLNKLRWPWVGGVERVAEQLFVGLSEKKSIAVTYLHVSQRDEQRDERLSPTRRIIALPNFFGVVEDLSDVAQEIHNAGGCGHAIGL